LHKVIVPWVKEEIQRRRDDHRAGRRLALELVPLLTAYAQVCHHRAVCNRYDERMGDYVRFHNLPKVPVFPSGRWDLLPSKTAAALHDLCNEVRESNRAIRDTGEVDGPEDASGVATHRHTMVAWEAWQLAAQLRRHYRLGTYRSIGHPHPAAQLRANYRSYHRGAVRRLWHALPMSRIRRSIWRLERRWKAAMQSWLLKARRETVVSGS
jgi:hypothetical protein